MEENSVLSNCVSSLSPNSQKRKRTYIYNNRRKKVQKEPLYKQIIDPKIIEEVLKFRCSNNCFSKLNGSNVLSVREDYLSKNERQRSLWIQDYLKNNIVHLDSGKITRWHICGKDICKTCWMKATTVTFHKMKNCYKVNHSSREISRQNGRKSIILAWFSNFFDDICDKMPTKEEFHLSCYMLWKDIMEQLNIFLIKEKHKVVEKSFFSKVILIYFFNNLDNEGTFLTCESSKIYKTGQV